MKYQGTHGYDATRSHRAYHFWNAPLPVVELVIQPAKPMGSRKHLKPTIVCTAIVEVNAHCDHLRQDLGRGLNLPHAGLL